MKTSQRKTIVRHLKDRGTISPMEALVSYGIYRLAAIIHSLREDGWGINTEMKKDGNGHKYARYSLGYFPSGSKFDSAVRGA